MSGTTILAQAHATAPISPAARVPISGSVTAAASDIARAGSPVVVTLSSMGIASDATNGLAWGAAPPSGATGQEAAINAALAAAWTNAGIAGLRVIWDVAVALGAPVYFPGSNTEIVCPTKACGAIMRNTANCPILRAPGTNANMTISANTQNTFGQYDPSPPADPPGSAATNYRVFNPAYVNARNLALYGGTWNAASPYQSQNENTAYGLVSAIQMWGVDGLKVFDITVNLSPSYHIHVLNCRNFEYGNILVDGAEGAIGTDALHINGPATAIRGGHLRTHCGDDNLSICADDGSGGGVLVPGINIQCGGNITDLICEGPDIWTGTENVTAYGSVRISSTYHRMDNIIVRNTIGLSQNSTLFLDQTGVGLCPGLGNYGHVLLDGYYQDSGASEYSANISVSGIIDFLEIRKRYRYSAQPVPDIVVSNAQIAKLHIEWDGYQPAGAANNTEAVLSLVSGSIGELVMRGTMRIDSSIGASAAPFLLTATGVTITFAELNLVGDYVTNLANHAGGTIGTLKFSGAHTNTGGGSPLAIASGATVTNYIYGTGAYPLAYKSGSIAAHSGSGTVTNSNAYSGP